MADRWTLALILICLPILATVITAFRIRDLPKSHDGKLDAKKPCENCDVKVGQKVHSVKIESDKHKYDELKKTVRDKQLINEKATESISKHKYEVKSDEDDDVDNDLTFSKIESGFKQNYPKDSKEDKSESRVQNKISLKKKTGFSLFGIVDDSDDDDNDDDDDDDGDDDVKPTILSTKPKVNEIRKLIPEKLKSNVKSSSIKIEVNKPKAIISREHSDAEDDNDSEDDDYEGLENIDELFKILDMKKKPSSKISKDEQKPKVNVKSTPLKDTKKKEVTKIQISNDVNDDDEDDNDEDDDDQDDDDDDDDSADSKIQESKLKITITKPIPAPKDLKDKTESLVKKTFIKEEKETVKPQKKIEVKPIQKEVKSKSSESETKSPPKEDKIVTKSNESQESKTKNKPEEKNDKKPVIIKIEEKPSDKIQKPEAASPKVEKDKVEKEKSQPDTKVPKKEEKKESKTVDAPKTSSKEVKDTTKAKSHEKNKESHDDMKVDKKPAIDLKKEPIIEHKKDIKYDFEKPNAYKDSYNTFDYSEFEKIQVSKARHKEKKVDKKSAETSDSREERYLKHVTDALNRRNLLKSEFEDFYAFFPTFAPNFSRIHNPECRRHGQILLRQLRGTKLWALNMLDATAKIPSGVLQGNGIQLGDFDQCLGSRARVQLDTGSVVKVHGKYCLARIDVKAENTELEAPVYLAQAKSLIRSRIDDPGHFVPRFSTLSWGVCVPAACDREDVEVIIKDAVKHYQHKSGVVLKVKVDEDDCHTDEGDVWEKWLELPTILTLSFYGVVVLLVLVATVQDFLARKTLEEGSEEENDPAEREQNDNEETGASKQRTDGILHPFSLYHSVSKLIAPGTTDEIACIHGIRGLATLALLVAHKFMPVAVLPYTNRVRITEIASSPLWSWCRAGWIFTDCFLLLSGTLTSHRIGSDDTGIIRRLFSRYLRLTPALLAVVLFYAYIWDNLSTGPMWGSFVTKNAQVCQEGWWWNILYVQNYFGLEDMCAPQTHQLALDMQLTIIGIIIIYATQSGIGSMKLLPTIHLIAAYLRYTTVRDHRLTLLAYHGVSVSQLYRTARLSYLSTLHRCSAYLIGLSLGMALKKPSKHGKILLTLGWLTSLSMWGLVFWAGMDSGSTQYRYNATFAAQYAAVAPLASAMAIAWVVYAVHSGTCEFLSRILCCRPLVFISRISYALYLCQFVIFITNIGTVRTSTEFTLMSLVDVQEISAILLSSTLLTITFVIPMQSLHKIFSFQSKDAGEPEKSPEKERKKSVTIAEESKEEKKELTPPTRSRHNLVAHREVLEEIPEVEVEFETQREITEGLDEIVEEEEGTVGEEEIDQIDDLEIIEEEEAGEEEALEREGERSYSRGDDRDLDEWEWTANGSSGRRGAQYYRYAR